MTKTAWIALGVPLAATPNVSASPAPQAEIADGPVHARLYLPDANTGYYRGTRFDWSGVIGSLEHQGHEYYPAWFQRTDPAVHDFIYDGQDIVAGPCTAVTGPAEEFGVVGFEQASAGGTFVKIGVGALRKPDDTKYDPYRLYPIENGGKWTVTPKPQSIEFRQELADPPSGYGYDYRKVVVVTGEPARLVLDHSLRNIGTRPIQTTVYNHNFLYLDHQAPGPGMTLTVPFRIQATPAPEGNLVKVHENQVAFLKTLAGEDHAYFAIHGFGPDPKDYDIRIEDRRAGAGVRITADRPLARMALWTIRAPLSIEPFIAIRLEPGQEFTWRIQYDYYPVPRSGD